MWGDQTSGVRANDSDRILRAGSCHRIIFPPMHNNVLFVIFIAIRVSFNLQIAASALSDYDLNDGFKESSVEMFTSYAKWHNDVG